MGTISVVVPTYRRPSQLAWCLASLQAQTRPADELIVVVRESDSETWRLVDAAGLHRPALTTVPVRQAGLVAALNAGLRTARGGIVVFTDDDAMAHPDWLERIETHFRLDPRIGAVGGRDLLFNGEELQDGQRAKVGRIQWVGRHVGNHHLGYGRPREVDVLKGVNMSFRRDALDGIEFDRRLKGGAEGNEIAVCLRVKRRRWKIIYDPLVRVDHYQAARPSGFRHDEPAAIEAVSNVGYNEVIALWPYLSRVRRAAFVIWSLVVGTRNSPGLVQAVRFSPSLGSLAWRRFAAVQSGKWIAVRQVRRKGS